MNPDPELLARLRDLHAPPQPPWWPPAPGWWLALLLVLVLIALAVRVLRPRWRRWRLRRRLLAALQAIARRHEAGAPPHATAAKVSQLLRSAALERFPARGAAGLQGGAWIAFLEASDRVPGRFAALGAALTVAPYAPPGVLADAAPLLAAARGWLIAAF
jgi:hypothetical protein